MTRFVDAYAEQTGPAFAEADTEDHVQYDDVVMDYNNAVALLLDMRDYIKRYAEFVDGICGCTTSGRCGRHGELRELLKRLDAV